jgi:arsenite methyltransferase
VQDDEWSRWLLQQRHGGDQAYDAYVQRRVVSYADRLLDAARLEPGHTLLDLGSGEGLVPFRAIERVGPGLQVIVSDLSAPMLAHVHQLAAERGVAGQCRFVRTVADDLSAIPDASVDVVTSRSVLAYVANKRAALEEIYRVLRPGGRISLAEPIFCDEAYEISALRLQALQAGSSIGETFLKVLHRCKAAQFPDTPAKMMQSPLTSYTERDLLRMAAGAGFKELHLELHIDMLASPVRSWDVFVQIAPHPWAPTLAQVLETECTRDEREILEAALRPAIESGEHLSIDRMAYLSATRT